MVDTGSSDGTRDMIRAALSVIPGELVDRPWKDFAHNRSESLALARPRADYSLVIDADEVLEPSAGFGWPALTADAYSLTHVHASTHYRLPRLVANRLPWRYEGVLHEYIECEQATDRQHLDGIRVVGHFDGGRSRGVSTLEKYARDADTLEQALLAEPGNSRYRFYLARSYRDSEQWDKAIESFTKRVAMGGFPEEIYESLLGIANIHEHLDSDPAIVIGSFLCAYENRPKRAEPLCALAGYLRGKSRFALARLFAARAAQIPRPDDLLFVDESVYRWRARHELAMASYSTGYYAESAQLCRDLLAGDDLPEEERACVAAHLSCAEKKFARAVGA